MWRSPVVTRSRKNQCGICRGTTGPMVQCDHCNSWYHFICVGVDQTVKDRDWTCHRCNRMNTVDNLDAQGAWGGDNDPNTIQSLVSSMSELLTPSRLDTSNLNTTFVHTPSPFVTAPSTPVNHNVYSNPSVPMTTVPSVATISNLQQGMIHTTSPYMTTASTPVNHNVHSNHSVPMTTVPSVATISNLPKGMIHTNSPYMTNASTPVNYNVHSNRLIPTTSIPITTVLNPQSGMLHTTPSYTFPITHPSPFGNAQIHPNTSFQPYTGLPWPQTTTQASPVTYTSGINYPDENIANRIPQPFYSNQQQPINQRFDAPYSTVPTNVYQSTPVHGSQHPLSSNRIDVQPPMPQQYVPQMPPNGLHANPNGAQVPQHGAMVPQFADPNQVAGLQLHQMMARQVIKHDLPTFSGHPEEWPLFLASFNQSTRTAGYTDDENIYRLRKALKGDALITVQGLLCDPTQVNRIILTLKHRFGQPESIIRNQIEKIRQETNVKMEKLDSIVNYTILVANLCATMESSMQMDHLNNPLLLQELVDKLPSSLKLKWGTERILLGHANVKAFSSWLENIAAAVSVVQPYTPPASKNKSDIRSKHLNVHSEESENKIVSDTTSNAATSTNATKVATTNQNVKTKTAEKEGCPACKKKDCKSLADCAEFKKCERNGRWNLVKLAKCCRVCLSKHHTKDCPDAKKCGINGCEKWHHKLLHSTNTTPKPVAPPAQAAPVAHQMGPEKVMFRVAPVKLYGPERTIDAFAISDEASSITLMEQNQANDLGLQGKHIPLSLRWTSGTQRVESKSELVKLRISGRHEGAKMFDFEARTVEKLDLPLQTVDMPDLKKKFPHLKRLPIESYQSVQPTVLIGIDQWHLVAPQKVREGSLNDPIATKTRLGWCLCGKILSSSTHTVNVHQHICKCQEEDNKLDQLIREFHSVDSLGVERHSKHELSAEERKAQTSMESTLKLRDDRYEVGLLWRYEQMKLPDSRAMAESRLMTLERKLLRTPELLNAVRQQLAMYTEKAYIRKVNPAELETPNPKRWYLPIFPVSNPNKPNKLRLVWDAAASANGVSLNSALLKGPDLYSNLFGILLRFGQHQIAITADIEQMFHRIYIRPEDQQSQLFLWRDCDPTQAPETYLMQVMLFGSKSSPYQSQYVMKQHASKFEVEYPRAVKSIQSNHYVDDLLDSLETEQEAIQVAQQIKKIHASGGFNIRNWLSNSSRVQEELNELKGASTTYQIASPDQGTEKVLGIFWCTSTDTITYSTKYNKSTNEVLNGVKMPTKRESLRMLMSSYDPLGKLSHFLIGLKILQQGLWRYGIGWDSIIPIEEQPQWKNWLKHLPEIEKIQIPRRYLQTHYPWIDCTVELITFVDASDKACSCVSYLRIELPDGRVQTALIAAKTKTAPTKTISIPKLELISAVMGVRLARNVRENLTTPIHSVKFFTDSTTVLYWLDTRKRLQSYMACRVGEILENSNRSQWYWIPSEYNVADKGTRFDTSFVMDDKDWFYGPSFLHTDPLSWPVESKTVMDDIAEAELEVHFHHQAIKVESIIESERFSRWCRILRATAYVHRFITNCRTPEAERKKGDFTTEELNCAELILFREAQRVQYADDYVRLVEEKRLPRTSPLRKLSPELDKNIIKMKGRITYADAPDEVKSPIILPHNHRITYLMVNGIHSDVCAHQFSETVVNEVRQKFHVTRLRALVKKVVFDCNYCHIRKASPIVPEMAPLPVARLANHCLPFTYTGVDLFGPISVVIGRRKDKRWGVIFTCLTVRAIHIEIATDLSTNAFIIAFRNFTNRRGQPREIYCDRGTNLVGASKVLQQQERLDIDDIASKTTTATMKWVFNPPLSPHMGGCWERLIRSIKSAFNVLYTGRAPAPDVLYATLVEIEAMINARPLTYIPITGPEEPALTPRDFLIGSGIGYKSLGNPSDEVDVVRHTWQYIQNMTQRAWKKWTLEYLPTLTRRSKWFENVPNLREGDVVIIVDETNKRRNWPKGRIVKIYLSKDGNVRSAMVQTVTGVYHRPASKLAKLDIEDKESEQFRSRARV